MTPPPTILDTLDAAERDDFPRSYAYWLAARFREDPTDSAVVVSRNHLRSLIEAVRAAMEYRLLVIPGGDPEEREAADDFDAALAPLLAPHEESS